MKNRILAILLLISIFASLSACSFIEGFFAKEGFQVLALGELSGYEVMSLGVSGDKLLVMTTKTEGTAQTLQIWNLKNNTLIAENTTDFVNEKGYSAEFTADGKVLVREYTYNDSSEGYTEIDWLYSDNLVLRESVPLEDYLQFESGNVDGMWTDKNYKYYDTYDKRAIIFYDEPDRVFIEYTNEKYPVADSGMCIAYHGSGFAGEGDYYITDYSAEKIINSAALPKSELGSTATDAYYSVMNEKYLCIVSRYEGRTSEEYSYKVCFWDYTAGKKNEETECESYLISDIKKESKKQADEIGEKYGITVDVEPDYIPEKPCTNSDSGIQEYMTLDKLDETFALLPEGMLGEMCGEYFDEFRICIVKSIDDNYSGAFTTNENGVLYNVFAADSFFQSTIAHELMHAIEYRIDNIWDQWEKLNPPGFEYSDGAEYADYDDQYFIRAYGQKNQLEDRATFFEELFIQGMNDATLYQMHAEGISNKSKFLCAEIRKAFPSVAKTDCAIWELPLEIAGLL